MVERSEGVVRIAQAIRWILVLPMAAFVLVMTFMGNEASTKPEMLVLYVFGLLAAWFLPVLVMNTTYWIADGFSKDKE